MSVIVDFEAIERMWGDESREFVVWLLMPGAGEPDARARVAAAIEATNEALLDWLDDDLHNTLGRPPVRTEQGAVWDVECFHSDGPRRWLVEFARRAEAAGLSGEVRARPYPAEFGRLDVLEGERPGRTFAVVMAPSGWSVNTRKEHFGEVVHVPKSRGVPIPTWKADPARIPDFVDLAMTFLADEPSRLILWTGVHSDVSRRALPGLMADALMTPREEVPFVGVRQLGPTVNRCVDFDPVGRVVLTTAAAEEDFDGYVRRACDLGVSWASSCDWVLLLENSLGPSYDDAYRFARKTKLPREVARRRIYDPGPLPDAFAWAVLSSAQLPASLDQDRWDLTALGEDRFVLASKDLRAWFAGPEALTQARSDWGIGDHPS